MCYKIFVEKLKILKASAGFEFMTYIFVHIWTTHFDTLLGNTFGGKAVCKIMLDFIACRSQFMEVSLLILAILTLYDDPESIL